MPKSVEIEKAKEALDRDLRLLSVSAPIEARLLPSLRELSAKYGLSKSLVQRVVRGLCNEGLLYPVHGMGTFVGQSPKISQNVFLFIGEDSDRDYQIRRGFEDRLSALGASVLSFPMEEAMRALSDQSLPNVQAVWDPTAGQIFAQRLGVPVAAMDGHISEEIGYGVQFDNHAGAHAATMHLIARGARSLVYLGVHGDSPETRALDWSRERAQGFLSAAQSVGISERCQIITPTNHLFSPASSDPFDYFGMGAGLAENPLFESNERAVVAANDRVAYGFLSALAKRGVSAEDLPPIVGFDASMARGGDFLTSVALPWWDLGRAAADLLFQRVTRGESTGAESKVATNLVSRLSGQTGWVSELPTFFNALREAEDQDDLLLRA